MPRFGKIDLIATARAHFHCGRSFIALDGTLRLYKRDWDIQKLNVLTRDNFKCQRCGKDFDLDYDIIDIHHKTKRSDGGSDDLFNLESVHRDCHEKEHPEKQPHWSATP